MADTKLEIMNKREIKDLYTQLDFHSVEPFLLPREFGASYANHERMLLEQQLVKLKNRQIVFPILGEDPNNRRVQ